MSYPNLLAKLYNLNRTSRFKYNLDATLQLSQYFDNPHKRLNPIHVTGTNGKGSTVYKLSQILIDNNIKTGYFTSPHLSTFRERIRLNNDLIPKEFIVDFLGTVFEGIEKGRFQCSFFEALTVMAYKYFDSQGVDVAVIEVGIGGKMDSTNILEHNLLAIITSIGLDHCELLGGTKEEILIQKAGIIKKGCPVLIGPEVPRVIPYNIAKELNSDFYQVDSATLSDNLFSNSERIVTKAVGILNSHYGMGLDIRNEALSKNLSGRMEQVNPSLLAAKRLRNIPSRVYMDVGHNPAAIEHCLKHISCTHKDDLIVVYGTSKLKDSAETLRALNRHSNEVHLIQANNPRAKDVSLIVADGNKVGVGVNVYMNGNIECTLDRLFNSDKDLKDKTVLICGSFFIMEEVRDYFGYMDEKDGVFLNEFKSL